MSDGPPELPPADLELLSARLRVEDGHLVRRNEKGGTVLRVPLGKLKSLSSTRRLNLVFGVVAFALAGGLAAIGYYVSEYNVLTVLLYVLAMAVGTFGLLGLHFDEVVLRIDNETIRVTCTDPTDDVTAFVTSLRQMRGGGYDVEP